VIFRTVLLALIAASAFAAGAGVAVVALAFALYALVEPRLGAAGAAATVAGVTAGLMALGGVLMMVAARPRRRREPVAPEGALERALGFIRQKPILAGAAAVGAGLLAVRNPKYLGEVLRSFLEGKTPAK
jgi:hypothetical protein